MKKVSLIVALLLAGLTLNAQKYITTKGGISFYSEAPLEKIEAHSNQARAMVDAVTGSMAFSVLIKSFEFEKALMQEHFNENYMESDKFDKATFDGKISNVKDVDFTKDGSYKVNVEGKLTIHGVTNQVKESGTIIVKGGKVIAQSTFKIKLKDYGIKNDKLNNISEEIEIKVNCALDPKK